MWFISSVRKAFSIPLPRKVLSKQINGLINFISASKCWLLTHANQWETVAMFELNWFIHSTKYNKWQIDFSNCKLAISKKQAWKWETIENNVKAIDAIQKLFRFSSLNGRFWRNCWARKSRISNSIQCQMNATATTHTHTKNSITKLFQVFVVYKAAAAADDDDVFLFTCDSLAQVFFSRVYGVEHLVGSVFTVLSRGESSKNEQRLSHHFWNCLSLLLAMQSYAKTWKDK